MTKTVTSASELLAAGRRLAECGFVVGTDGNLSMRHGENTLLITPSGAAKGELAEDDLLSVDLQGNVIAGHGKPSSEIQMHLSVYSHQPDIGACIHSHPPYTTAHAVAGVPLESDILPEVVVIVGPIALTQFAPPGTPAVGESLQPFLTDHTAFVLRNHGLLTIGRTVREALYRHETVEHFARISFLARQLGGLNKLPVAEVERLSKLRQSLAHTENESH